MDAISHLLKTFRLQAEVFHNAKYCTAFNIDTTVSGKAAFHVVSEGRAWLVDGKRDAEPVELHAGDLVLFPRAGAHRMVDSPETLAALNAGGARPFEEVKQQEGAGLVCGYLEFDHPSSNPLLDVLPDSVVVRGVDRPDDCGVCELLSLLVRESVSDKPGVQVTLNRLCDVVFVLLMREYLANGGDVGLGAALADKRIGRSLNALHDDLAADWSVEALAQIAAMSRAGFAARFKEVLGVSPVAYLTTARMQAAYRWLKDNHEPVASVAARTGYATEAAFAKAFKRELGVSPGAVRKDGEREARLAEH
ncbi:MAG: AraC family transcriptional regulator [Gammaproteobacteria bacterium]